MAKECLAIPTEILVQENILPAKRKNKALYIPLSTIGGVETIYNLTAQYGEYRDREGEQPVEKDPNFQQLIMYAFVLRDRSFLAYQRGSHKEGNYDESRLEGKISLGLGGHIERSDLTLEDSLYREIDEEAEIWINNEPINFRHSDPELGPKIWSMKNYIDITPVGLIKDERDSVGKVHLGIACRLTTKLKQADIRVKTGRESVSYRYLTPKKYQQLVESHKLIPEGWSDIVFRNEILTPIK
ncbi:MAG: hypothetical protein PHQ59_05245 [Candidatus Daviesbacteria bacterium]|nr:hypothetical protein [Candidatus Daviesbacteria bacterium]